MLMPSAPCRHAPIAGRCQQDALRQHRRTPRRRTLTGRVWIMIHNDASIISSMVFQQVMSEPETQKFPKFRLTENMIDFLTWVTRSVLCNPVVASVPVWGALWLDTCKLSRNWVRPIK